MDKTQILIFQCSESKFAFQLDKVKEIIRMPELTTIPDSNPNIRGVVNLRDKIIPVYDLRKIMGFKTSQEEDSELIEMLKEREQDHKNWLDELTKSVQENREFKLTTDPHQCKFGKWYYNFKTNNLILASFLERFEQPHAKVHEIAIEVNKVRMAGDIELAQEICDVARATKLKNMVDLFHDLYDVIQKSRREFAIILEVDSELKAINADRILSIQTIDNDALESINDSIDNNYIDKVFKADSDIILILSNIIFGKN